MIIYLFRVIFLCNGNFEYYSQLPTGISQIGVACPWGSVNDASLDYYHANSTAWESTVPSNSMGYQESYYNFWGYKGYAGFGAHDSNNILPMTIMSIYLSET